MSARSLSSMATRACSLFILTMPFALAAQGCGVGKVDSNTRHSQVVPALKPKHAAAGIMPMRKPEKGMLSKVTSASGAQLTYRGGPVIPNVEIVEVNWGSSVTAEVQTKMPGFYKAITQSPYFDWLVEYDTPASGGTNQKIGRGSFYGSVTISPSSSSSTIDDTDIQSELTKQISAGKLPAPNGNRLYMIDFPPGLTITMGGDSSCSTFCAYHGSVSIGGQAVPYGVHPDMSAGSPCDGGCGGNADAFSNMTSVHSHEMIESVTDMDVGEGNIAWYDDTYGEIGDICNAEQDVVTGYVVQKEWSNSQGAC
ncbi:MAG: hypothetical protein ACHREM_16805, partial [Polyangiales bacterium]